MKIEKDIKKKISVPAIRRLPLYLCFLKSINDKTKYITAREMAQELHVGSTQITKDFSYINMEGTPKLGYETKPLINAIERFLGYDIQRMCFLIGVGNIGKALLNFSDFKNEGMEIIKGFDVDDNKYGHIINNVEVFNINSIEFHFKQTPADIGIIAVPSSETQNAADLLIKCGIKAIWNFSTMPISAPKDIIVENTCIDSSLAMIKWKLNKNVPLIYKNRII